MTIPAHNSSTMRPYVATIGFFDGVHLGHRYLIDRLKVRATQIGAASMVITFTRHPQQVVRKDFVPQLLLSPQEKLERLEETGIDRCVVLNFDAQMAALSAREFMQTILKKQLNVVELVIGHDNKFGHNRQEGIDDYRRYGKELGIDVIEEHPFEMDGLTISSSVIRRLLTTGDISTANRCLGYAYTLSGKVIQGFQEGRKMGFPTANLTPEEAFVLLPGKGVYATKVRVAGFKETFGGMTNIGNRPTFGGKTTTIETHILDFKHDIYDSNICVSFIERIRNEERFDSIEALRQEMMNDEKKTRNILKQP